MILLVHGKSRDIRANHSKSLFRRFIQCVGQLTIKVNHRTGDHFKGCQSLIPPITSERRQALSAEVLLTYPLFMVIDNRMNDTMDTMETPRLIIYLIVSVVIVIAAITCSAVLSLAIEPD